MSEETKQPDTIEPERDAAEPPFRGCWVDDEREIVEVEIGGVKFRLRSITVGEERRIADEMNLRHVYRRNESGEFKIEIGDEVTIIVAENKSKFILTVAAALGVWTKYGSEGWNADKPISMESVESLKGDVLDKLYVEYAKYFRCF